MVNLRPIVPGHVLVVSRRVTPRLSQLTDTEYTDLWHTVRIVQHLLVQQKHDSTRAAFNVAVQDGSAAGQSVPHVHVHLLPRRDQDLARNDDIYEALEEWAPSRSRSSTLKEKTPSEPLNVPEDSARRDRTAEEMAEEAATYRRIAFKESSLRSSPTDEVE